MINPLINAVYRARANGATLEDIRKDVDGDSRDYPGSWAFNQTWETFRKYDIEFDTHVSGLVEFLKGGEIV